MAEITARRKSSEHASGDADRMDRRKFIILLGVAAGLASPAAAELKKPRIGLLSWLTPTGTPALDQFRDGMQRFGYVEGKNYEIEAYFTGGNRELTREIARKFVQEPVDILVVIATPAVQIAKEATHTIPIVMQSSDALATGLVPSLSHPGGNLTGLSLLMTDLAGKRLELLHAIRPDLHSVAFLGSTKDPQTSTFVRETQAAASRLGVALSVRLVDGPAAIDQALFDGMKSDGNEAVIVSPIFFGAQDRIVAMAMKARLPVIADFAAFAEVGALLSYGMGLPTIFQRTAYYVDRILKGAKPADLPIEQPTEFELVINARTARELGWTIPQDVAIQADRVLE
jgi:putative tryptophan/tyrosine transport system substrate-binding protein